MRHLLRGPATADALVGGTDLAGATILAVLTRLEEEGLVAGAFGRYRLAGALHGVRAIGGTRRPTGGRTPVTIVRFQPPRSPEQSWCARARAAAKPRGAGSPDPGARLPAP